METLESKFELKGMVMALLVILAMVVVSIQPGFPSLGLTFFLATPLAAVAILKLRYRK